MVNIFDNKQAAHEMDEQKANAGGESSEVTRTLRYWHHLHFGLSVKGLQRAQGGFAFDITWPCDWTWVGTGERRPGAADVASYCV